MKRKTVGAVVLGILLVLGSVVLGVAQETAAKKVRVIVENALVHIRPDFSAEVLLKNVARGTIYEVTQKTGAWYEIRVRNEIGILIAGFIHEKSVEAVAETPRPAVPPPVKKPRLETGAERVSKTDLRFGFGLASGSLVGESSAYSWNWTYNILKSANESGTINHAISSPLGLGAALGFSLLGNLSGQLRLDYFLTQKVKNGRSAYTLAWTWTSGISGDDAGDWPATGELSLMPVSFDLIMKLGRPGRVVPFAGAGVTYFLGKVKMATSMAFGSSWTSGGTQYIDFFVLPLAINKSLGSVGFNLGGGVDVLFGRSLALTAEVFYFIGKSMSLAWSGTPGKYYASYFTNFYWDIAAAQAEELTKLISPLAVKTSFLQILVGLKIFL